MAKDERELRQEVGDIADMTWSVARRIGSLESVDNRTPENVQVCIDALYRVKSKLERLKAPLLMKEN